MKIKDLKKWHILFFETGLIVTLLLFLAAFSAEFKGEKKLTIPQQDKDAITLDVIPIPPQKAIPPPPPKPRIFQPVPDDTPLEDLPDLDDTSWDPEDLDLYPYHRPEEDNDEPVPFKKVERKPELIGGKEALYKKITYPRRAIISKIEGVVQLEFTVDPSGNILNPLVVRGIGGGCDLAALKALKQMKFKPGLQRGKPVPVRMKLSVIFRLQ